MVSPKLDPGLMRYRFGPFEVHREHGRLLGPDGEVRLRPQAYRVLETLLDEAPRIVSGDELVDRAWDAPFVSASSIRQTLSELRQALGDDAQSPRFIETVHRRGYRMIAPLEELSDSPAGETETLQTSTPRPRSATQVPETPYRGLWLHIGALTLGALTLVALLLTPRAVVGPLDSDRPPTSGAGERPPLRLQLDNLSSEPQVDWIASAVEHLLRAELAILASIETLAPASSSVSGPGHHLRPISSEPADASGILARGSFLAFPGDPRQTLQLQVQILDATSGAYLGWAREHGSRQDLPRIIRRLARSIRAVSGAQDPRDRALWAQLDLASSTESLRLFAEAMKWRRQADNLAARPLLEQAVLVDPDNPLHHEALAAVYDDLGFERLAAEQAIRAAHLAEHLPLEQKLLVTARLEEMSGNFPEAATSLRALYHQYPDTRDYGLRLTNVLMKAGRFREAQAITHELGATGQPARLDPRLALLELKIHLARHRLHEAEAIARQLVRDGPRNAPAHGMVIDGLWSLFKIHLRLGDLDAATDVLQELEQQAPATHHRHLHGFVEVGWGHLLGRKGQVTEGIDRLQEAADTFRSLGDVSSESGALNRLAFFLQSSGHDSDAVVHLERAIELNRRGRNLRGLTVSLSLMAVARAASGQLDDARRAIDESLRLTQATDDHHRKALSYRSLARVLIAEDRLLEADASYRSALELSLEIGDRAGACQATRGLGRIAGLMGRSDEARRYLGEAAAEFDRLHLLPHLLGTQVELAQIALASARFHESRRLFTDVLEKARNTSLSHYSMVAERGLARLDQREEI